MDTIFLPIGGAGLLLLLHVYWYWDKSLKELAKSYAMVAFAWLVLCMGMAAA